MSKVGEEKAEAESDLGKVYDCHCFLFNDESVLMRSDVISL
ncbi:hypothetical protein [Brevibacillus reuszeri]|nr:hypothetical protein [Brevibacillus reuszeri]